MRPVFDGDAQRQQLGGAAAGSPVDTTSPRTLLAVLPRHLFQLGGAVDLQPLGFDAVFLAEGLGGIDNLAGWGIDGDGPPPAGRRGSASAARRCHLPDCNCWPVL